MISRRGLLAGAAAALVAPKLSFASVAAPKRIVTIGGPITEIGFGLGCGERIVAVDATSRFPRAARRKADAGFHDDLAPEKLLALSPDLVLIGEGSRPEEAITTLSAASVKVVSLKDVRRRADITERIRIAGDAVGEPDRGAALADAVTADLASVASDVASVPERRRTLVLLGLGSNHPLIAAGAGTPAALALDMAGSVNAAAHVAGWRTVKDAHVAEINPDAIVALSMGAPLLAADVSAHPALKHTTAARENRVAVVDGMAFVGFGPRVAHLIATAARAIYPEAGIRALPARGWVEDSVASL